MFAQKETVVVTTAAAGEAGLGYSKPIRGRIFSVQYVKGDFANGVDFTITLETSGIGIWAEDNVNASAVKCPRQPAHSQVGAALYFNDESNEPVPAPIVAVDDRVKIVIAQGGDEKSGTFHIIYG